MKRHPRYSSCPECPRLPPSRSSPKAGRGAAENAAGRRGPGAAAGSPASRVRVSQTGCGAPVQPDDIAAAPERKPVFTNQLPQRIGDDLRSFVLLRLILRPGEPFGEDLIRDRLPQRPAKRVELSNLALRQAPFIDRAVMSFRIGIPEPCRNDSRREDYGISCRLHPEPGYRMAPVHLRQVPDPAYSAFATLSAGQASPWSGAGRCATAILQRTGHATGCRSRSLGVKWRGARHFVAHAYCL